MNLFRKAEETIVAEIKWQESMIASEVKQKQTLIESISERRADLRKLRKQYKKLTGEDYSA